MDVAVGAAAWYCDVVQGVRGEHTALVVGVARTLSYSVVPHARMALQVRSDVAVGCTRTNSDSAQTVIDVHARSLETVGWAEMNCEDVHVRTSRQKVDPVCGSNVPGGHARHLRSLVAVGHVDASWPISHVSSVVHPRSDVCVGCTEMNSDMEQTRSVWHTASDVTVGAAT